MLLIIGYGNPLRSDDGIGPVVVQTLKTRLHSKAVRFITAHQLTPELAEPISRASLTIFIDACEGEHPGVVTCSEVMPQVGEGAFTHNVTPASLLASSRELYGNAPAGLLISVSGASFEYSTALSPQLMAALPHITEQIDGLIGSGFSV